MASNSSHVAYASPLPLAFAKHTLRLRGAHSPPLKLPHTLVRLRSAVCCSSQTAPLGHSCAHGRASLPCVLDLSPRPQRPCPPHTHSGLFPSAPFYRQASRTVPQCAGGAGQRSGVNVCDRTRAEGSCGTGRVAWQGGAIGMHGSWTVTHRRGLVPQLLRHRAVAGHLRRWTRGEVSTHHRPCCCTRHQPSRCSGRYRGMRSAARLE